MIKTSLKTDIGLVRSENQDYLAEKEIPSGKIIVVCDGMGGHFGGAKASQIVTEAVIHEFNSYTDEYLSNEDLDVNTLFTDAFRKANDALRDYAEIESEYRQMATTIVAVWIYQNQLYYSHLGDSRLYLSRKKALRKLTKDHSPVQEMADLGLISEEDMDTHPESNIISRYLGAFKKVIHEPPVSVSAILENDLYLICTDGLNNMLSKKEIENVLNSELSLEEKANELIMKAKEAGGRDNISVALIQS